MGALMKTYTGRVVDLDNIEAKDIDLTDISMSLARTPRFNGHTSGFYSVACHSILVQYLVPAHLQDHALIHDAHEAYMGDLIGPMKAAIGWQFMDRWHELQNHIDAAIHAAMFLPFPLDREDAEALKAADTFALHQEMAFFSGEPLVGDAGGAVLKNIMESSMDADMKQVQKTIESLLRQSQNGTPFVVRLEAGEQGKDQLIFPTPKCKEMAERRKALRALEEKP